MRAGTAFVFLMLSFLVIAAAVTIFIIKRVRRAHVSLSKQLLYTAFFLFGALWLSRFSIEVYTVSAEKACGLLTGTDYFVYAMNAFMNALRTFMADGEVDLVGNIHTGQEIIGRVISGQGFWPGCIEKTLKIGFAVYEFVLDAAAPLVSGAAIVSVISDVFPIIKIKRSFFREKYVFSELNEESVTLAESIQARFAGDMEKRMPMIIFTDTYIEDENEAAAELIQRAKRIGCVCVKNDILKLKLRTRERIFYILSDLDQTRNLTDAAALSRMDNGKMRLDLRQKISIYVFSDLDETEEILKNVRRNFETAAAGMKKKKCFVPVVVPIKEYKNCIYTLLSEKPLFKAIEDPSQKELTVTIIGTGKIGTEAFLAVFWCGQLLDIKLNINVVSLEAASTFRDRINRITPCIFESADPERFDTPYCRITLIDCDMRTVNADQLLDEKYSCTYGSGESRLYDTNYYIVSLGTDRMNVDTAYMLRRSLERSALRKEHPQKNVIVACSVYNDALSESVRYESEDRIVELYPFASFSSRYNYDNIFQKRLAPGGQRVSASYNSFSGVYTPEDMKDIYGDSTKRYDHYKHWSNIARFVHSEYRKFSVGAASDADYIRLLRDDAVCDDLAWLEHRRWNAFLWTMGYEYCDVPKDLTSRKVHPCLVEARRERPHRISFHFTENEKGKLVRRSVVDMRRTTDPRYDELDKTSGKYYTYDVKRYDYPQCAGLVLNDDEMRIYLNVASEPDASAEQNRDEYKYELYKCRYDRGERLWALERYLLDEETKAALDKATGAVEEKRCVLSAYGNLPAEQQTEKETAEREKTNGFTAMVRSVVSGIGASVCSLFETKTPPKRKETAEEVLRSNYTADEVRAILK
ncbi:MAG: hypothetical protein IJ496_06040 [Ruminococcus sp.]|nr:hypothetical protein [Ruminococcus sp.]